MLIKLAKFFRFSPWLLAWGFFLLSSTSFAQSDQVEHNVSDNKPLTPGQSFSLNGVDFAWCPGGSFKQGCCQTQEELLQLLPGVRQEWYSDAVPCHEVRVSRGFWIGKTEVTRGQWYDIMGSRPWVRDSKSMPESSDLPATHVSWEDANEFLEKLTSVLGVECRLPTESEWEYACRAGTTTIFGFGDDTAMADGHMWHWGNTIQENEPWPHEVAQKEPNAWDIYDFHGNVWEWCETVYAPYKQRPSNDREDIRVIRGGSYMEWSSLQLCSYRSGAKQDSKHKMVGFRILIEMPSGAE